MALALTKLRFSLPYKAARTSALALLELVASGLGPRPNVTQQRMDYITTTRRSGDVIHPLLRNVGSGAETKLQGERPEVKMTPLLLSPTNNQ